MKLLLIVLCILFFLTCCFYTNDEVFKSVLSKYLNLYKTIDKSIYLTENEFIKYTIDGKIMYSYKGVKNIGIVEEDHDRFILEYWRMSHNELEKEVFSTLSKYIDCLLTIEYIDTSIRYSYRLKNKEVYYLTIFEHKIEITKANE